MTFCEVWQHNYLQYCILLDFECIPFSVSFLNTLDSNISSPRGGSIYIFKKSVYECQGEISPGPSWFC